MSETKSTRRRALEILGVGGAAALAAQLPASRATAATGDPLILGDTNVAEHPTNLRTDFAEPAFVVVNDASEGVGVEAHSKVGVLAFTRDPDGTTVVDSAAVRGVGFQGHGVLGQTEREDCAGVRGEAHVCLERGPCEGEAEGIGVHGLSEAGPGVRGDALTSPGVYGESAQGPGVFGLGKPGVFGFGPPPDGTTDLDGAGVVGLGFKGHGVTGKTENNDAAGVRGEAHVCLERGPCVGVAGGTGVHGSSEAGIGVRGDSDTGPGVEAASTTGPALRVLGRSQLATVGNGTIPQGQISIAVAHAGVTATSHISVTLMGNPGPRELLFVDRDPGVGFTVNLTSDKPNQRPATPFSYLVVEPA
jgi:hypothetical protein